MCVMIYYDDIFMWNESQDSFVFIGKNTLKLNRKFMCGESLWFEYL